MGERPTTRTRIAASSGASPWTATAGLSANGQVIRVLRLIGARDITIATAFVRRFTKRAALGAAVGTLGGMAGIAMLPRMDAAGGFCCAIWGQGAVVRFDPDGRQTHRWDVGGRHSSCPAFGGPGLSQLLVTTARDGIDHPDDDQGKTWRLDAGLTGLPEPRVIL